MGIWVYADIILLSPSRTGLQEMVKICENFAKATNNRIEKCKTINALFFLKKVLIIMKYPQFY